MPWILLRSAVWLELPADRIDLRLYAMAQASLAGTLLLAGAAAALSRAPRLVLAVLGTNALAHLLLDACEVKWGGGVHLLAPLSWRATRFGLFANEGALNLALTAAGLGLILWELLRAPLPRIGLTRAPRRVAVAALLAALYLTAPLAVLGNVEASDSYSIATLRDVAGRTGCTVELDRARFRHTPIADYLELWTGERLRVTGRVLDHDAPVSLRGVFTGPHELRIDAIVEHRFDRDWPSYAALALLAVLLARGFLPDRSATGRPSP